VTIVGHSLGGGVAMQFAYQFPERLERLVLVSSGGLGREVSILLRAATLPGAEIVIPLLGTDAARSVGRFAGRLLTLTGQRTPHDLEEISRGISSLADIETRQAFVHTARGIIGLGGQRVSARDRLYLAEGVPTLIMWGERDPMMPAKHGVAAHQAMPGSRLEIFLGAGHFPHREDPERFVELLEEFMWHTEPAQLDPETLRERLRAGAA
jgi:pimeloyl-ACP methyl ester carboxylesterase